MGNVVGYYSMIQAEIERITNILKDASAARALNRENIIEDARNRANQYNQMQQGAQNMMNNIYQGIGSQWGNQPQQGRGGYNHQQGGQGMQPYGNQGAGSTFGMAHNPYGNQGNNGNMGGFGQPGGGFGNGQGGFGGQSGYGGNQGGYGGNQGGYGGNNNPYGGY